MNLAGRYPLPSLSDFHFPGTLIKVISARIPLTERSMVTNVAG